MCLEFYLKVVEIFEAIKETWIFRIQMWTIRSKKYCDDEYFQRPFCQSVEVKKASPLALKCIRPCTRKQQCAPPHSTLLVCSRHLQGLAFWKLTGLSNMFCFLSSEKPFQQQLMHERTFQACRAMGLCWTKVI